MTENLERELAASDREGDELYQAIEAALAERYPDPDDQASVASRRHVLTVFWLSDVDPDAGRRCLAWLRQSIERERERIPRT